MRTTLRAPSTSQRRNFLRFLSGLVTVGILVFAGGAWAQSADVVERTYSGTSDNVNPQGAKREIQDKGAQKISEDLIKDLIGEDRYVKNKSLIQSKVLRFSNRYIPVVKPGELQPSGQGFAMTMTARVSVKELKALLQKNSLLSENDNAPLVLPLISFIDKMDGQTFRWWKPEEGVADKRRAFLVSQDRHFETALRAAFEKNNFYLIKGLGLSPQVPHVVQNERLNLDDMQLLGQYFGAPLLLDGQVQYSVSPEASNRYRVEVKLVALQASNGRAVADVSRRFDTEAGVFEIETDRRIKEVLDATAMDLATQVNEAWQKGALGTTILRLTFRGKIPFNQKESFKDKIRSQFRDIRNIRERMITADTIAYEVDTSLSAKDFSAKLNGSEIDGRHWNATTQNDNEVVLQVQR